MFKLFLVQFLISLGIIIKIVKTQKGEILIKVFLKMKKNENY